MICIYMTLSRRIKYYILMEEIKPSSAHAYPADVNFHFPLGKWDFCDFITLYLPVPFCTD